MHFGIIAAGEGSRLAGEGVSLPKPLVKLNGQPMIGRLIELFLECGAESVNVVVNEQMPQVREFLESFPMPAGVPLNIKVKSTPSSMHTFAELASMLPKQGRFIATTVDTIFRAEDFRRYAGAFAAAPPEVEGMMAMTSFIDDEKPLYIEVDSDFNILAFRDKPWEGMKYISGGIYGLGEGAFKVLDDCMERGVSRMRNFQRALVESGMRLKGYPMGKIMDVDHASDIADAEKFLESIEEPHKTTE